MKNAVSFVIMFLPMVTFLTCTKEPFNPGVLPTIDTGQYNYQDNWVSNGTLYIHKVNDRLYSFDYGNVYACKLVDSLFFSPGSTAIYISRERIDSNPTLCKLDSLTKSTLTTYENVGLAGVDSIIGHYKRTRVKWLGRGPAYTLVPDSGVFIISRK